MTEENDAKLAYFHGLEEKMLSVLGSLRRNLPNADAEFVAELIDVHELGLALEVLSNMLVESKVALEPVTMREIEDLAETMGLKADVVDQLRDLAKR
jgi:hypothetical protein